MVDILGEWSICMIDMLGEQCYFRENLRNDVDISYGGKSCSPTEATEERKRQYSALRRAVNRSCNPALVMKMQNCSDTERCVICFIRTFERYHHYPMLPLYTKHKFLHLVRFSMLKTWLVNDSLDSIHVEERYVKMVEETSLHKTTWYIQECVIGQVCLLDVISLKILTQSQLRKAALTAISPWHFSSLKKIRNFEWGPKVHCWFDQRYFGFSVQVLSWI